MLEYEKESPTKSANIRKKIKKKSIIDESQLKYKQLENSQNSRISNFHNSLLTSSHLLLHLRHLFAYTLPLLTFIFICQSKTKTCIHVCTSSHQYTQRSQAIIGSSHGAVRTKDLRHSQAALQSLQFGRERCLWRMWIHVRYYR